MVDKNPDDYDALGNLIIRDEVSSSFETRINKFLNKETVNMSEPKEPCYHQWRYFNKWCQECSEFGHGVIVSHCFKCGKYWDAEFGFWTKDEIDNIFFNEFFHDTSNLSIQQYFKKITLKKNGINTDKKSKN